MGLLQRLGEVRNEQIERKAQPFLIEDEEIVSWVRARHPDDGRKGVFFITSERALVRWSGRKDGDADIPWTQFRTWGVSQDDPRGPVICVENQQEEITYVQLAVETRDMARVAMAFIRSFAEMAPWPEEGQKAKPLNGWEFQTNGDSSLNHKKRTPKELAIRIGITVLGVALIIVGIAIIPLPGPWSFLLNIAGLAVLAREYDWADDMLEWTKERFEAAKKKVLARKEKRKQGQT
ncbi:MAG: PGPGW domain-containing protein [Actinomycetota bacterium]